MSREEVLRLLIIDASQNDAEALASTLRNAGNAVRATLAEDDEDMEAQLTDHDFDLILCSTALDHFTVEQALAVRERMNKTIPLIAVTDKADDKLAVKVMQAGARDLVSRKKTDHLRLVVERESEFVRMQRTLAVCRKAAAESEKRARNLVDSSRDAITYVHEGMHIYANSVYLGMFGFEAHEEIEGTPIMDMVAPEDHAKFKEFLRNYTKSGSDDANLEVKGLRPDGTGFNALMEFSPASVSGEACTQIIIRDQSISKELEKKIKHLSKQDLLTGLYNRQYFLEELERVLGLEDGPRGKLALLYVLVDNFKSIKESVGIAGSDLVISDIAGLVRNHVCPDDVAARFTDNAFTVLLPNGDSGLTVAETIRRAVEEHIADVGGQSVTATCSIGISTGDDHGITAHDLLARADVACDIARTAGGNRCHKHDVAKDEKVSKEKHQEWTQEIQDALEQNRLRLVFQPIVNLQGEPGEQYEVLVRMVGDDNQLIAAREFIPASEESGLITAIDRRVLECAIDTLSEHRRNGHKTTFFIKLAGASLTDEALLPWLADRLKSARLQGDALTFEIAESTACTYLKDAKAFANGLKQLRCGFAIEHFGKSENSFHILKHLPADYLKIDGSLMHRLAESRENQEKVKQIAETAHSMGKITIAEFVEDAGSLSVLWQYGIKFIQGNFLQEPHATLDYQFVEEIA